MRHVIILALILLASPLAAQDTPQISVIGRGEVTLAPDMARVTVGVAHEAKTASAAMDQMSRDLRMVLQRLTDTGIAADDMQTSSLRLDIIQDYGPNRDTPRVTGYMAHSDISVTVRDLDDLGAILDAVVADGANQLSNLQFDVADRAPHLTAARQAAVADARAKADTFANAAGASLGAVQMIQEGGQNSQPMPLMEMRSMAQDSGVPIAAGEIVISAQVAITYALSL